VVESDSFLLWLLRTPDLALREQVEGVLVEYLRKSDRRLALSLSSVTLHGIPSHFEFTFGTCSGILTEDTLDIPGGFFRPGF
jgi:hypothetical protein